MINRYFFVFFVLFYFKLYGQTRFSRNLSGKGPCYQLNENKSRSLRLFTDKNGNLKKIFHLIHNANEDFSLICEKHKSELKKLLNNQLEKVPCENYLITLNFLNKERKICDKTKESFVHNHSQLNKIVQQQQEHLLGQIIEKNLKYLVHIQDSDSLIPGICYLSGRNGQKKRHLLKKKVHFLGQTHWLSGQKHSNEVRREIYKSQTKVANFLLQNTDTPIILEAASTIFDCQTPEKTRSKNIPNFMSELGREILKCINPAYLKNFQNPPPDINLIYKTNSKGQLTIDFERIAKKDGEINCRNRLSFYFTRYGAGHFLCATGFIKQVYPPYMHELPSKKATEITIQLVNKRLSLPIEFEKLVKKYDDLEIRLNSLKQKKDYLNAKIVMNQMKDILKKQKEISEEIKYSGKTRGDDFIHSRLKYEVRERGAVDRIHDLFNKYDDVIIVFGSNHDYSKYFKGNYEFQQY